MTGHDPRTPEDLAAAEEYGVTWSGTMVGAIVGTACVIGMDLDGSWSVWNARAPKRAWCAYELPTALAMAALANWGET